MNKEEEMEEVINNYLEQVNVKNLDDLKVINLVYDKCEDRYKPFVKPEYEQMTIKQILGIFENYDVKIASYIERKKIIEQFEDKPLKYSGSYVYFRGFKVPQINKYIIFYESEERDVTWVESDSKDDFDAHITKSQKMSLGITIFQPDTRPKKEIYISYNIKDEDFHETYKCKCGETSLNREYMKKHWFICMLKNTSPYEKLEMFDRQYR